ncbi:hypothetical protein K488DRAFT_23717, partial [Vararia minispora EC-137]
AVKTGEIYAFYSDTRRLGINTWTPRPPESLTVALSKELDKYDQLCDIMESQLLHAVAVLQRDLNREEARMKAEADLLAAAEAAKTAAAQHSPPDVDMAPAPALAAESVSSIQSTPLASPSIHTTPSARRPSTISFSSLNRPQFAQKLDLSAAALHFSPDEIDGRPPSPVTLAPKSARPSSAGNDFSPEFMASSMLSEQPSGSNRPVDIDLTLDDVPTMESSGLGSSADRPIELDLDIDMTAMSNIDLFGDT